VRILIATDGSPSAAEAVDYGLELAAEQQADVSFLHVLLGGSEAVEHRDSTSAADRDADDPLLRRARALAATRGVSASVTAVIGDPVSAIGHVAEAIDADLIVVGSRGLTAAAGSVSRGVLRVAGRPVVAVRGVHVGTSG
jgi:nucleotide-binding universal stress UspA family protein